MDTWTPRDTSFRNSLIYLPRGLSKPAPRRRPRPGLVRLQSGARGREGPDRRSHADPRGPRAAALGRHDQRVPVPPPALPRSREALSRRGRGPGDRLRRRRQRRRPARVARRPGEAGRGARCPPLNAVRSTAREVASEPARPRADTHERSRATHACVDTASDSGRPTWARRLLPPGLRGRKEDPCRASGRSSGWVAPTPSARSWSPTRRRSRWRGRARSTTL